MKKILSFCAALLMAAAASGHTFEMVPDSMHPSLSTDSIGKVVATEKMEATVSVAWPTQGNETLVRNVRKFVAEVLSTSAETTFNAEAEGQSLITSAANVLYKNLEKEAKESFLDLNDMPNLAHDLTISAVSEYENQLIYNVEEYIYLGGVHGSYFTFGRTFDTTTGEPIVITIDPEKTRTPAFQELLKEGLTRYVAMSVGEQNIDVNDYLLLPDDGLIPLPVNDLWIVPDGVVFQYQSYEIGPYALGLPSFCIPLDQLKPFLSQAQ